MNNNTDFVYTALLNEYFSLGATGESAIEAMFDDLDNDRLQTITEDWKVELNLIVETINALSFDIRNASLGSKMCDGLNYRRLHNAVKSQRQIREAKLNKEKLSTD